MIMKTLFFAIFTLVLSLSLHAQAYETEITINKDNSVVSYKVKNNTEFDMVLMKGYSINSETMKSYCKVFYQNMDNANDVDCAYLEVAPYKKIALGIKPKESYVQNFYLSSLKEKKIIKVEGHFLIVYQETAGVHKTEKIVKTIKIQ